MNIDTYEQQLRRHDPRRWRQYKQEREGFIAKVVNEHAQRGERVTHRQAVEWWREKVARRLGKLNGGK
jgi:hypothetical protein